MFAVSINRSVVIEGCPKEGIEAVDFRRQHGLPERPTNKEEVNFTATDESLFRRIQASGLEPDYQADYDFRFSTWAATHPFRVDDYKYPDSEAGHRAREYVSSRDKAANVDLVLPPAVVAGLLAGNHEAVVTALERYAQVRAEAAAAYDRDRAAYDAAWEQEQRERQEREAALARARELLADELAAGRRAAECQRTLSEFLSVFPDDALRGALKAACADAGPRAIEELKAKVEAAATCGLFEEEDEEEEEDDY